MLKHAADASNIGKRRRKASTIVTALITPPRFAERSQTAPPRTGRVRDDWVRAVVVPRVALDVPCVNARDARVRPIRIDKQSGDHAHPSWYRANHLSRMRAQALTEL